MVITGIGHWIKIIVFYIANSTFDVVSDILTGLHHNNLKNVTRYLGDNSTVVPDNCFPHPDVNVTRMFECREKDTIWSALTFACVHLPSVLIAVYFTLPTILYACVHGFSDFLRKILLSSAIFLVVPFPIIVFVLHVTSLFVRNSALHIFVAGLVYSEGLFEAAPQLILQTYIILSDCEREIAWIQIVSILTSVLTISKITIEMFLSETFIPEENFKVLLAQNNDDSMLTDKSFLQKLKLIIQFSPAVLTSLVFKVGSISIICTFLKEFSAIYFGIGIPVIFLFFCRYFTYRSLYEKFSQSATYSAGNMVILTKDLHGGTWQNSRKESYAKMMAASIIWLIVNTSILVGLMVWVAALDESNHLSHWSEHRFAFHGHPTLFLSTTSGIILMGPISIFFLWRLKHQVKALATKEGKVDTYWGVDRKFLPPLTSDRVNLCF